MYWVGIWPVTSSGVGFSLLEVVGVPLSFRLRSWCLSVLTVSSCDSSWWTRKKRHSVELRGNSEPEGILTGTW